MSILTPSPVNDQVWQAAWRSSLFRKKLGFGLMGILAILIAFPYFFQTIERHTGPVLTDWVLDRLPPADLSITIFLTIWVAGFLLLIRVRRSPAMFMMFIYSYIIITLSRMLTINLFPLNPPVGLIPLVDPLTNAFYGKTYITKDLFYSGHTSTIFLIFMCLRRKWDRLFAFAGTLVVGVGLLIQHVHYTIDVLGAFVFTYPLYRVGKWIALSGWNTVVASADAKASPEPNPQNFSERQDRRRY